MQRKGPVRDIEKEREWRERMRRWERSEEAVKLAELIFGLIIAIVVNIFIFRGGLCMLLRSDYKSAKTAAIVALLFPITSLFGLWALFLLGLKI
jgi:hypothetical protein